MLGHSLEAPERFADGLESYLGDYLEGLIVDDQRAVDTIRRWFLEEYQGGGGLVVLPLDRCAADPEFALPSGVRASGNGAPWLRRLLHGVKLADPAPRGDDAWIGPRESLDSLGALRLGRPAARAGLLAHRAELERLELLYEKLEAEARQLAEDVQRSQAGLSEQLARLGDLETARREFEEEVGRLAARAEAAAERRARLEQEIESAKERVAQLEEEREAALQRAAAEDATLAGLRSEESGPVPDPQVLAAMRAEWETLRERLTATQLDEARAAAALERADRELQAQQQQLEAATDRSQRVGREQEQLQADLARAREGTESADQELEALFREQDRLEAAALELDGRAEGERQRLSELDALLRRLQQEERDHSERRHELELERTQIGADLKRTRERLEDEWGRPFEELSRDTEPAEGEPAELRRELRETAERLANIGLVNMLAEEEYQEEKERLDFLEDQRADLVKARDDLRETIRQINETASAAFLETLDRIRANFERTFATLFEGGECDVWLEDPADPLDSPVEISASPRGKRTQRIHLLSGGERALTALALLFAIYLVKPSPFCVLDEVDAPLDETNILRFVAMLEEFKSDVQFIVITHNPVTIEAADWIYGVTMEEPGVSKIVGVEFSDYARGAVA